MVNPIEGSETYGRMPPRTSRPAGKLVQETSNLSKPWTGFAIETDLLEAYLGPVMQYKIRFGNVTRGKEPKL
jgi:hypothetical protein